MALPPSPTPLTGPCPPAPPLLTGLLLCVHLGLEQHPQPRHLLPLELVQLGADMMTDKVQLPAQLPALARVRGPWSGWRTGTEHCLWPPRGLPPAFSCLRGLHRGFETRFQPLSLAFEALPMPVGPPPVTHPITLLVPATLAGEGPHGLEARCRTPRSSPWPPLGPLPGSSPPLLPKPGQTLAVMQAQSRWHLPWEESPNNPLSPVTHAHSPPMHVCAHTHCAEQDAFAELPVSPLGLYLFLHQSPRAPQRPRDTMLGPGTHPPSQPQLLVFVSYKEPPAAEHTRSLVCTHSSSGPIPPPPIPPSTPPPSQNPPSPWGSCP